MLGRRVANEGKLVREVSDQSAPAEARYLCPEGMNYPETGLIGWRQPATKINRLQFDPEQNLNR